jgi:site-specific DNA-methyltransferase (adenine-specific)
MTIDYRVGDVREQLALIPQGSIQTTVTSPPYNIGVKYDVWDDNLRDEEYRMFLWDVAKGLLRATSDYGSLFLQVGSKPSQPMRVYELLGNFLHAGWQVQNDIIWVKSISIGEDTQGHFKTVNSPSYLNSTHEHIFHLTKNKVDLDRVAIGVPYKDKSNIARFKGIKADKRCRGNVWFIPYPTTHGPKEHPASFPLELPLWCLQLAANKGMVLDPFAGSGTTLLAARMLGLDAIEIDVSAGYKALWENK